MTTKSELPGPGQEPRETTAPVASGVQELIDQLRQDGVAAGREEAARILAEAEAEAEKIRARAAAEAKAMTDKAAAEAKALEEAGVAALRQAARDAQLALKAELTAQFSRRVQEMVGAALNEREIIEKILVEIAGRLRREMGDDEELEVVLPEKVVGLEELRRQPELVRQGPLGDLTLATARELLRDGVRLAAHQGSGVRIRLTGEQLELEIDEATVAELLLAHLLPRFRALLEGAIG